jgi:glycolate oxidase iron-sulfur subunit
MSGPHVTDAPAMAAELGLRRRESRRVPAAKLAVLADLDLDFLVVVNPGCQRQLMTAIRRARLRTKVVHLAEFVASAQADHR